MASQNVCLWFATLNHHILCSFTILVLGLTAVCCGFQALLAVILNRSEVQQGNLVPVTAKTACMGNNWITKPCIKLCIVHHCAHDEIILALSPVLYSMIKKKLDRSLGTRLQLDHIQALHISSDCIVQSSAFPPLEVISAWIEGYSSLLARCSPCT